MNELNKWMSASLENNWNDALNGRSAEEQQRVQSLLNELTSVLQRSNTTPLTYEQLGDRYAKQGAVQQATIHYLKAFEQKPSGEIYEKLAAVYASHDAPEDAHYYAVLAAKVRAYSGFSELQKYAAQEPAIQQQAEQMLHYPESYANWLTSVLEINREELAIFEEEDTMPQVNIPIIEEKRRVHAPKAQRQEAVEEHVQAAPIMKQQPITPAAYAQQVNPIASAQQPSPYVDPRTFIAAQNEHTSQQEDEFTDFEEMYFGEMYEDDKNEG